MSTQTQTYPNLSRHFGKHTFVEPSHAGQRVCRDVRNTGMIPVRLDEAERLVSEDPDSLTLCEAFTGEFIVVRQEAALTL